MQAPKSRGVGAQFPFGDAKSSQACRCITSCQTNEKWCLGAQIDRLPSFAEAQTDRKGGRERALRRVEIFVYFLQRMKAESKERLVLCIKITRKSNQIQRGKIQVGSGNLASALRVK